MKLYVPIIILKIVKAHKLMWYFFCFAVLGLELRAYTLSHSTSPVFLMEFFEIESLELFALAGLKRRFS
jgi:hypothetical protein